jgi:hypothetical protein
VETIASTPDPSRRRPATVPTMQRFGRWAFGLLLAVALGVLLQTISHRHERAVRAVEEAEQRERRKLQEALYAHDMEKARETGAALSAIRRPEESQHTFVRLVVDKAAMTFEGQPTTWYGIDALLEAVPNRSSTVLEFAVTSDQITVQQQNEWFGNCIALAHSHGFAYASFIGIHPLGSKGTPVLQPQDSQAARSTDPNTP